MTRPYRSVVVAALAATLLGLTAPTIDGGERRSHADRLPPCPVDQPPPTTAPVGVPSLADPTACRARPSRVERAADGQLPTPRPGYHHLGATTAGDWNAITGRLEVRRTGVRPGRYDFVATRFLAKQDQHGQVAWLEVGWADTGWSGDGAPQVYAFDSTAMSWRFFDAYRLRDRDRLWVYLHGADATTWYAWLWWGTRWQLLAAAELPMGATAQLEQYVEVHLDRSGHAGPFPVPPISVDRVRVSPAPGRPFVPWRPEWVPTVRPADSPFYCLTWNNRYHSWAAGGCPDTVQG